MAHVIRKYIREGQYVQEGSPLFDVADLRTVWIQAQVYEDELNFLPEGLTHNNGEVLKETLPIIATTKSLPNEEFHGMLTFVYPHVDQQTRTVTVRFELDNPDHKLRPGSTATVTIKVPPERWALLSGLNVSDPERQERLKQGQLLGIPQSAVIDTGNETIVYREAQPGVFEGVLVKLGPKMSGPDNVTFFPVLEGLEPGTKVVTAGSFLVDAETRLNPSAGSIYFGGSSGVATKTAASVRPSTPQDPNAKVATALAKLSPDDRRAAELQRFCPVLTKNPLGSMGTPVKMTVNGETFFLCCTGCRDKALSNPAVTVGKVKELRAQGSQTPQRQDVATKTPDGESKIAAALAKLTSEDRPLAERQRFCAVLEERRLGSMGVPVKLTIDDQVVFVCCSSCRSTALKNPQRTVAKAKALAGGNRD